MRKTDAQIYSICLCIAPLVIMQFMVAIRQKVTYICKQNVVNSPINLSAIIPDYITHRYKYFWNSLSLIPGEVNGQD